MPSDRVRGVVVAAILSLAILPGASQSPALEDPQREPHRRIGSARRRRPDPHRLFRADGGPRQRSSGAAPPWIRITPAVRGSFYWSGTQDPDLLAGPVGAAAVRDALHRARRRFGAERRRPRARRAVRVLVHDADRPAALGGVVSQAGRVDSPAVIALRFNQPVRPEDVVAHAHAALRRTRGPRRRCRPRPANGGARPIRPGLARFDRQSGRRTARDVERGRRGSSRRRFVGRGSVPARADLVVLETTSAPPPEGWLDDHDRRRDAEPEAGRRMPRSRRSSDSSRRSS